MRTQSYIVTIITVLLFILLTGGCSRPWSVNAKGMGEGVCGSNVRVDIVGVNSFEKEDWMSVSLEDYWLGKSPLRNDAKTQGYLVTQTFDSSEAECMLTITEKNQAWKKWKKEKEASHVIVLIDKIPEGGKWRISLPLKPKCWQGDFWDKTKRGYRKRTKKNRIIVHVLESGVVPITLPIEGCE